jgi:ankyrin repeat protein
LKSQPYLPLSLQARFVAKLLLEHGADRTVVNADGWKPLNAASNNGHVEVVKMLLEKGADMTITNANG